MEILIQENKEKQLNNELILVAISNDTLIIMKDAITFDKYLIEGDNNQAYLVEGDINIMSEIIHNCLNARETGIVYQFRIDNILFKFK